MAGHPMTASEHAKAGTARPLGWWTRQLIGGVGWPTVLLSGVACFMTLQSFELPGRATAEILPAILLWGIVGLIWLCKPIAGIVVLAVIRYPSRTFGWDWLSVFRHAIPPILLAVSIILVKMDYPLERAIEISAVD